MSELPKGWIISPLADVTDILDSIRKPVSNKERLERISDKKESDLYHYFGATGQAGVIDDYLFDEELVALGEDGVPFFDAKKHKAYMLRGKTWVNNHAHVLRGSGGFLLNKYLCEYLNQFDYLDYVNGGTRLKLTQANMKRIPIPLAPLAEQKRIVEKLDEVLARVDIIKARLDGIPALLKRFRQSVLASAVSGKLTEEWRGEGDIEVELNNVSQAYRKGWESEKQNEFLRKGKAPKTDSWKQRLPSPYLPTDEDEVAVGKLPQSWKLVSVDQLTKFVKDGPHYSPKYSDEGIEFISGRNITVGGIDFSTSKYITKELHEELSLRCKPEYNDVLLTKGGTTGIACVNKHKHEFNVWVHVAVLRVTSEDVIMPEYLSMFFNSPVGYFQSQKYTHGVANRDLGLKRMIKICLGLPSIEEQKEIVRLVDQYFAFADTIEAQVKKAQARVDNLTQSILAKAFRGELVEQDPNDEPADKLLERIAQARKEAEALAKAAKKAQSTKSSAKKKAAKSA